MYRRLCNSDPPVPYPYVDRSADLDHIREHRILWERLGPIRANITGVSFIYRRLLDAGFAGIQSNQ